MSKTTLSKIRHIVKEDRRKIDLAPSIDKVQASSSSTKTAGIPTHAQQGPVRHPAIDFGGNFPAMDRTAFYRQGTKKASRKRARITTMTAADLSALEGQLTMRELSERYDIPSSTLYRWAKKTGYKAKNGIPPSPIPDGTAQMIRRDLRWMTTAELAERYAIPYHVLYHWLKREGLSARKVSCFPRDVREELRERCRTSSLKALAQEYGLSQQAMRRRLQDIGCFSDGKGGFLVVDEEMVGEIITCCQQKGLEETAKVFCTTRVAVKSFLKKNPS